MRGLALAVPVLALMAPPLPAQDGTGLNRLTRRDQLLGWEGVGRLDIADGGFCTGTLIATDLVLTAGHCVFDSNGVPVDAARLSFRAGLADGVAIAEGRVLNVVVHPDFHRDGLMDEVSLRHDVALLQLETPIPAALAAPFTVDSPGNGDKVSVVSYAQGREEALSWQKVCSVLGRRRGLIAVDCNVTFGASGAPVLDRSFGRARIVSIISVGRQEGNETMAFGMELPGIVSELKAMLRQGKVISGLKAVVTPTIRRIGEGEDTHDTGARFVKP